MERPKAYGGFPTPGLQAPNGDTVMDKLFFLTETEWECARNACNFDFVIVGSGFCGLAVAKRALREDHSCRILIIERGPFFLQSHFQNLGKPFDQTIALETFPWTMSAKTAQGETGIVRFQHGMVPNFGGRSVMWSAWCPRPTIDEMHGWPQHTVEVLQNDEEMGYFSSAIKLLHVKKADSITEEGNQHVYGKLQETIQSLLNTSIKCSTVDGIYSTEPAPLAVDGRFTGIDFAKYSVPAELLDLASKQKRVVLEPDLDIVTNCIVEKIHQQDGTATALQTSRGVLALGDAKLILAMGTLPPATLVRNSFPDDEAIQSTVGERFGGHFISSITARVLREDVPDLDEGQLHDLEMGAFYIAGKKEDYTHQYHIQLTAISDKHPLRNAKMSLRYMPDVVATASKRQLLTSPDHVVFVCAVLGELNVDSPTSWFKQNNDDTDLTTNSILEVGVTPIDTETWDAMDEATFGILENVLSHKSPEYWHGSPDNGKWTSQRPSVTERRVDMLVHESSTLHIGDDLSAPVDTNYCLRGTSNVYVTGGALWPRSGSWNPTLTMVAMAQHLADQLVEEKKVTKAAAVDKTIENNK